MRLSSVIVSLVVAAAAVTSFQAAARVTKVKASNHYVTKTVQVGDFDELVAQSSIDVVYCQSDTKRVAVYAPDNVLQYIQVSVKDHALVVGLRKDVAVIGHNMKMKVTVWDPDVRIFKAEGSGDIKLATRINANRLALGVKSSGCIYSPCDLRVGEFNVGVTGSGDVDLRSVDAKTANCALTGSGDIEIADLKAGDLKVACTGSGDVKLAGKAKNADYANTGSGDLSLGKLHAEVVKVANTGSGDVKCSASQTLSVANTGSGEVEYSGGAHKVLTHGRNITKD